MTESFTRRQHETVEKAKLGEVEVHERVVRSEARCLFAVLQIVDEGFVEGRPQGPEIGFRQLRFSSSCLSWRIFQRARRQCDRLGRPARGRVWPPTDGPHRFPSG